MDMTLLLQPHLWTDGTDFVSLQQQVWTDGHDFVIATTCVDRWTCIFIATTGVDRGT